ncbi:MAG: hypothetical protein H6513_07680 [Acidimicrobiaceae bacterium]|nr:hypothetical protein [Ilumatobacter sp.]MCB9380559.1 hypothetical protein [Acidimicrobiaceae bacterium]
MNHKVCFIGAVALLSILAACGSTQHDAEREVTPSTNIDPAGATLLVLPWAPGLDAARSNSRVTVTDTGCVYTQAHDGRAFLLAFDPGSALANSPRRVILPDGSEVVDGETYDFGGGGINASELALPEIRPTWETALEACHQSGVTDIWPAAFAVASVHAPGTLEA